MCSKKATATKTSILQETEGGGRGDPESLCSKIQRWAKCKNKQGQQGTSGKQNYCKKYCLGTVKIGTQKGWHVLGKRILNMEKWQGWSEKIVKTEKCRKEGQFKMSPKIQGKRGYKNYWFISTIKTSETWR